MQTGTSRKIGQVHTFIKQIYSEGAVRLMDLDANPFTEPTKMDQLKKYHVWGDNLIAPRQKWL